MTGSATLRRRLAPATCPWRPLTGGLQKSFNREGQAFDKGETLSGVPYEVGLAAVEKLRPLVPNGASLAQLALRWILMNVAHTP